MILRRTLRGCAVCRNARRTFCRLYGEYFGYIASAFADSDDMVAAKNPFDAFIRVHEEALRVKIHARADCDASSVVDIEPEQL